VIDEELLDESMAPFGFEIRDLECDGGEGREAGFYVCEDGEKSSRRCGVSRHSSACLKREMTEAFERR